MPRLLAVLAVLCIALPAVALAAADTDPKERLNAADLAKARSIVLKRTDFAAGWKKVPPDPDTDAVCPGFNPDGSDLSLTGKAESDFEHTQGFPMVSSFADVYVTKSDASASWSRTVKPALARCLAHFMREGAKEEGVELKIVSQGRLAFPKVAPHTAAFRVVSRMTVQQPGAEPVTVPLTIHVIVVGRGRGEAGLFTAGFGNGVAMPDLQAFARLIAGRMAAAKL